MQVSLWPGSGCRWAYVRVRQVRPAKTPMSRGGLGTRNGRCQALLGVEDRVCALMNGGRRGRGFQDQAESPHELPP